MLHTHYSIITAVKSYVAHILQYYHYHQVTCCTHSTELSLQSRHMLQTVHSTVLSLQSCHMLHTQYSNITAVKPYVAHKVQYYHCTQAICLSLELTLLYFSDTTQRDHKIYCSFGTTGVFTLVCIEESICILHTVMYFKKIIDN